MIKVSKLLSTDFEIHPFILGMFFGRILQSKDAKYFACFSSYKESKFSKMEDPIIESKKYTNKLKNITNEKNLLDLETFKLGQKNWTQIKKNWVLFFHFK
ncbi:hypothetical protein [Metamycoplasma orale]|uniref:Uncharacterized protein n=2 Tax=Metamycoplasma orale TaxID=2121 RepID=A0A448ZWT3_METOS|nr:hypothetical protein [Metamycoplasma orale]VEU55681.1 Uncharacterised protein [Metamycoplasma orale]